MSKKKKRLFCFHKNAFWIGRDKSDDVFYCPDCEKYDNYNKHINCHTGWSKKPYHIDFTFDGYHTFDSLYHQRLILFATIVNAHPDISWKSLRHEDGKECFGGGWFIVGINTPQGQYTYHYETKHWDLFKCKALDKGEHWDGHTDADVERLLSL